MARGSADEVPDRPVSARVVLVVLGVAAIAVSLVFPLWLHPPIGQFRVVSGSGATRLHLSAGDRYTVYGGLMDDSCTVRPTRGVDFGPTRGFGHVFGRGRAEYDLAVRRTGSYTLTCNPGSFGDYPDLYLGPDTTRVSALLAVFFPGLPLAALLAWALVRRHRHRAVVRAWRAEAELRSTPRPARGPEPESGRPGSG